MKILATVIKNQFQDSFRSKWIIVYSLFYFLITFGLILFTNDSNKIILSLMNVNLIVIPLVCIVFGNVFFYNNREYIIMILAQPVDRKYIYLGLYFGLTFAMSLSFLLGVFLPIIFSFKIFINNFNIIFWLIITGILITFIFVGIAFLISMLNENKLKGLGISIFSWFLFTALYDAIILMLLQILQNYPLEIFSLTLTLFNPIDITRIIIINNFDIAALMGFTGAVFNKFFGSVVGFVIALFSLINWIAIPLLIGLNLFNKKDF